MKISEISKITNLPISTLRYYDKHGLLRNLKRNKSGIRVFDEKDLETLRIINCLKTSGMKISEIKKFMDWCSIGDSTIKKRLNMFYEQEKNINQQIDALKNSLELVKFKEWYYETAMKDKSENRLKKMNFNELNNLYQEYKNN